MLFVDKVEGGWKTHSDTPGVASRKPCLVLAFPEEAEDVLCFVADQEIAAATGIRLLVIEEFEAADGRQFALAETPESLLKRIGGVTAAKLL